MDWTGGARRRFAPKKNNAALQRQKAYFAKARAALNAPSQRNVSRSPARGHAVSVTRSLQHRSASRRDHEHSPESLSKTKLTANEAICGQMRGHAATGTSHGAHRSAKGRYRSPSIISISSRDCPSTASCSKPQLQLQHQENRRPTLASKDTMNEEERVLLAERRRLLAQSDWLGLAPARPVHMKFSSSYDKDRIGKRRKMEKSRSKKGEPAGRRLLSPLFEERLQQQDHMMSGALVADDFQIRIGTDAFATQTQQSHRSQNSGRTSMRQPSTEFELLSEESMLLGPDEENFDSLQELHIAPTPQETVIRHSQQLCDVANMSHSQNQPERVETPEDRTTSQSGGHKAGRRRPEFDIGEHTTNMFKLRDEQIQNQNTVAMRQTDHFIAVSNDEDHDDDNDSASDQKKERHECRRGQDVSATVDDDDEIWRDFMNVARRVSSNPSMTALKSSSLHETMSESSPRSVLDPRDNSDQDTDQCISTPNGAGTQGPAVLNISQAVEQMTGSGSSEKLPSPSVSFKQITKLATCTTPPRAMSQEKRDENEIWREFICGSQDDSESSSQLDFNLIKQQPAVGRAVTLDPASSLYVVSDLGTSNQTTTGGDMLLVEESLFGTNSQESQSSLQHKIASAKHVQSTSAQNSLLTENHDDDIIEDDETINTPKARSKNIYTPRTTELNPNRFLPPQKRHRPQSKRSSSFLPARQARNKAPRLERSVYDLVDSEGNSVV